MRSFFATLTLVLALIGAGPGPATAQDVYLRTIAIAALVQEDPAAALEEIDATLAAAQAQGLDDPRLTFDLNQLKVDLLLDAGQLPEATALLIQLAGFAAGQRERLDIDPIPLHRQAADLLIEAGELRAARAQHLAILEAQRDGGASGEVLAATLRRLADISGQMGRTEDAEGYQSAAAEALKPDDGATRGDSHTGYREVEVFYATDRARTGEQEPEEFYGWGRGALELGTLTVTIPDTHTKGKVERPSIWRLEFAPNPAKHVVLKSITPVGEEAFYNQMQARIATQTNKEALVFIHGYNVKFAQAAKRAAQISYDMGYGGLPVLYSWPSAGSTVGYISDTAVVRLSGRRLSRFLDDLVARSGAETVHIVAHSMGNRALTDALELMAARRETTDDSEPVFGQILFAAPDVDAGLFAQMIESIRPLAQRLTLYSSREDWALASSRRLHGNAPRAGQGGEFVLVNENIDSVDMSELGEDMLAHSYFADDSSALADMMSLFWHNAAPYRRCGLEETAAEGFAKPYWTYRRGSCSGQNLIDAMSLLARGNLQTANDVRAALRSAVKDADVRAELEPVLLRMVED